MDWGGIREDVTWLGVQVAVVALLHVLLELFCYWSVTVKAAVGYVPTDDVHRAHAVAVGSDQLLATRM